MLGQHQEKQRCKAGLSTDSLAVIQEQWMLGKIETSHPSAPERRDLFLSTVALIVP